MSMILVTETTLTRHHGSRENRRAHPHRHRHHREARSSEHMLVKRTANLIVRSSLAKMLFNSLVNQTLSLLFLKLLIVYPHIRLKNIIKTLNKSLIKTKNKKQKTKNSFM